MLKVFRKLEPGINPELEMLRFLTEHGFENIAPLQGWYEYEGRRWRRRSASPRSSSPTRAAAGSWRSTRSAPIPTASWSALGSLGTVTAAAAQRARLRRRRPRVLARGAQPGGAVAADGDRRRGHRADLPAAARRRAPGADRRPRPGRARAAGCPRPDRDRRPRDPDPRRLPPRPDPVHAARLGDHRLRGRARAAAARAPPEALAAARRGGHAALVRLCHLGGRDAARPGGSRGLRAARAGDVPRALPRAGRRDAAARRRGRDRATCCRSSSSRRRSTSCATSSTTAPTGSRSRSRVSADCWRPQ